MRQVDGVAADRRTFRAHDGQRRGAAGCGAQAASDRLCIPGTDPDAVDQHAGERAAAAAARPCSCGRGGRPHRRGLEAGGTARVCRRISARIVGRHEDADVVGARARHRSGHPVDGRAVCRARRDHSLPPQQRPLDALADLAQDRHRRDPLGVRIRLPVAARGGDDGAAGQERRGDQNRGARAAQRRVQDVGCLCRLLPQGFGGAGAVLCGAIDIMSNVPDLPVPMSSPAGDTAVAGVLRILLPVIVAAAGTVGWELVVRINDIPPYVLPGPVAVVRTLVADWPVLWDSLLTTLLTTVEGFAAAAIGGIALALLFNQSKWLEYSLFPYAVILQVTPVIAIAPLLLIYLPQQTAVIVCAWIVGFFPVLSNTTLGLTSVDRN